MPATTLQTCGAIDMPAFAYRVWLALNDSPPPNNDTLALLVEFVGDKTELRTETLRTLLTADSDEPRAPCAMEALTSVVSRVCLSSTGRAIPRVLTQAGTADAREALISYTATWKALHPDHRYSFVDVDDDADWGGVPSEVLSTVRRALNAGYTGLAADVVRHALLYYRGGIVADLGAAVDESVSCVLAEDDDLVEVFATDGSSKAVADPLADTSFMQPPHPRPIAVAVAATPRHGAVLARLDRAMQRVNAALSKDVVASSSNSLALNSGAGKRTSPFATPRALTVVAHQSGAQVLVRGQGPRIRHRVDSTLGV